MNVADRFDSIEPVEAATDIDAMNSAKQLLRMGREAKAVEVWILGNMVGRVDRERS